MADQFNYRKYWQNQKMRGYVASGFVCAVLLTGCSSNPANTPMASGGVSNNTKAAANDGAYKLGPPYTIGGITYVPKHEPDYNRVGLASRYGARFHGRRTANGEIYDENRLSAAHPTLPLPSYVRITNLSNGIARVVRINDRGPFVPGRIIDVSDRTARELGFGSRGLIRVRVEYVGMASK